MAPDSSTVWSILTSAAGCIFTFGVMKGKSDRLEEDVRELGQRVSGAEEKYVTIRHFESVVQGLHKRLDDFGSDVKEVLGIVRERLGGNHHRDA